jgi:hypothetical protein
MPIQRKRDEHFEYVEEELRRVRDLNILSLWLR